MVIPPATLQLRYTSGPYQSGNRMKTLVYPGTFNPITNGHTDLVERAAKIFDHIIVAVGTSTQKNAQLLSLEERVDMAGRVLAHLDNVEVCGFSCLLTDFVKQRG